MLAPIIIHGAAASECLWLLRYCAEKACTAPDSALLITDRIPPLSASPDAPLRPCVARLSYSPPSQSSLLSPPPSSTSSRDDEAAGPADCLALLSRDIDSMMEHVSLQYEHGHDSATLPTVGVGLLFESIATLLVEHPLADVAAFLAALPARQRRRVRVGVVAVLVDAATVGFSTVTALATAMQSHTDRSALVVRVDDPPRPVAGGEAALSKGMLTVTEALKSGRSRSFNQEYTVSPAGVVCMLRVSSAPASAALQPFAAKTSAPSTLPAAAVPAVSPPPTGSPPSKSSMTTTVGTSATLSAAASTAQIFYMDGGDGEEPDDGVDDDLDY